MERATDAEIKLRTVCYRVQADTVRDDAPPGRWEDTAAKLLLMAAAEIDQLRAEMQRDDPSMKTPEQILAEIDALKRLGESAEAADALSRASIAGQIDVLEWVLNYGIVTSPA